MIGEVVTIKATGERVFVLGKTVDGKLNVRRPSIGQNGIVHTIEYFEPVELESIEDNLRRELNEMILKGKLQRELMRGARIEEAANGPVDPSLN